MGLAPPGGYLRLPGWLCCRRAHTTPTVGRRPQANVLHGPPCQRQQRSYRVVTHKPHKRFRRNAIPVGVLSVKAREPTTAVAQRETFPADTLQSMTSLQCYMFSPELLFHPGTERHECTVMACQSKENHLTPCEWDGNESRHRSIVSRRRSTIQADSTAT